MAKFRNPETGGVGEIDATKVQQALVDGMEPLQDLEMFNPETKGVGTIPAANAAKALQDGLLPVGSREHQVATTGKLESVARGAAQGGTFGGVDEIQAGVRSIFGDKTYTQYRDEYRQGDDIAREANPITYGVGELGGGIATALLPIPGLGLAKGATLAQEAMLGAKIGGVAGLGYSEHDLTKGDAVGVLNDVKNGALLGGAGSAAIGGIGRVASGVGSALAKGTATAFGPEQRLLAMGARTKDLNPKLREQNLGAARIMEEAGVFERNANGSRRNQEEIYQAIIQRKDEAVDGLHALIDSAPTKIDPYDVIRGVEPQLMQIIKTAPAGEGAQISNALWNDVGDGVLNKLEGANSLADLWTLKKEIGSPKYVGNGWDLPPNRTSSEVEAYKEINRHLEEVLHTETEALAANIPGMQGDRMRGLNKQYAAAVNIEKMLGPEIARNQWQASSLGLRFRDVVGGGMVGGMANAAGAGPYAATIGAIGGIANAAFRSPAVRIARAQLGEKMHLEQLEQGKLSGMIPRQLDGFKEWLSTNSVHLSQSMPHMQMQIQKVLAAPPAAAEIEIRALMPMMQNFMQPSTYPSEFNGKVTAPADRLAAQKKISSFGLTAKQLAVRMAMLNRDGKLPPEAFAPDEYGDELLDYANKLTKQGY